MSTVLAAVDDSLSAGPVLTMAAAVAPVLGSTVEAVHVGPSAGTTARGFAERAGVPFRTEPGRALDRLVQLASDDVTVVVVGSRDRTTGRTGLGHLVVELADRLPRPVLVVPPHCAPADRLRSVLVALEGTRRTPKPLRQAMSVASGSDLQLTVVHVEDESAVPSFSDSMAHEMADFATEYLARYWPEVPAARLALPLGDPVEMILATVEMVEPDLLVAGWPQGKGPAHGLVIREVLRRSPVPVLLVATA
jgi:nucleotide-binding universal stress UspA family protein